MGGFFYFSRFGIGLSPGPTIRLFTGLNQTGLMVTSDAPAGPYLGLSHRTTDPVTGSGALQFVSHSGGAVTREPINLLGNFSTDSMYDFMMYSEPFGGIIYFTLDDLVNNVRYSHQTTLTLPPATTMMAPQCQMSNGTANITADTLRFDVAKVYVEAQF